MSMEYDATVGQIGFRIILQLMDRDPITKVKSASDVSGATELEIDIRRPDGTTVTYVGAVPFSSGPVIFTPAPLGVGDGSDGYIEASTAAGDLNQEGAYEASGYYKDASEDGPSQVGTFTVGPSLR